jgi:hypothetical protein
VLAVGTPAKADSRRKAAGSAGDGARTVTLESKGLTGSTKGHRTSWSQGKGTTALEEWGGNTGTEGWVVDGRDSPTGTAGTEGDARTTAR